MSGKADFFERQRFALVGDSTNKKFPKLTHKYLLDHNKTVYAVDLAGGQEGYLSSLTEVPEDAEAAIIEVAKENTTEVVSAALDRGFDHLWIHQMTETPEAVVLAKSRGATLETGGCAVMYLAPTASPHVVHRAIWKLLKRY